MKGFNFIEVLLVVAIMLTISVMAPVFYSRFLLQNEVANTVDQLSSSLRKAQIYSMVGKQNDAWSLNYSNNTITVYKGLVFTSRNPAFDEKFSVNSNVAVAGITDVNFARLTGTPTPLTSTIEISSGNNLEQITINSQGVVSR